MFRNKSLKKSWNERFKAAGENSVKMCGMLICGSELGIWSLFCDMSRLCTAFRRLGGCVLLLRNLGPQTNICVSFWTVTNILLNLGTIGMLGKVCMRVIYYRCQTLDGWRFSPANEDSHTLTNKYTDSSENDPFTHSGQYNHWVLWACMLSKRL